MQRNKNGLPNAHLLTQATRIHYQTLLDANVLNPEEGARPAIIYVSSGQSPVCITQKEFHQAAHRYGAALLKLGVAPGDLVVIAYKQDLESIYAFWGALLAGIVPTMFPTLTEKLDPTVYMANMSRLVELSDVRAVLTTDEFAVTLQPNLNCPVYGSSQFQTTAEIAKSTTVFSEQIAFLQHSSGTTGLQKGVALSHQAVLNQLASYSDALHLAKNDVIVSWLPLYHDMGLIAGFLLPLVQGIPLVLLCPFDWVQHPALLFRAIHDYKGTLCWLPNFAYNHCARRIRQRDVAGLSLASIRCFINCSEPVSYDSHELFLTRFAANNVTPAMLGASYAMAENTFAVTQTPPGRPVMLDIIDPGDLVQGGWVRPVTAEHVNQVVKASSGFPIAGTSVEVMDDAGQVLPERHVGELAIQSDCLLTEYYNRPELQSLHNGRFHTGDLGYMANGELYVIGRIKDLIINAGKNIYPQDLEAIVNQVLGVYPGRVVVFGVFDEREGTELIAVVAEVERTHFDDQQKIKLAIRQAVARQSSVTISYVHIVQKRWLIKTSSGKIARNANRNKWLQQRELKLQR